MIFKEEISCLDRRSLSRLDHPFVFHDGAHIFEGKNFSPDSIGVIAKSKDSGEFDYFCGQLIKDTHIEIEGVTVYLSHLRVARLDQVGQNLVYGMVLESVVTPEQAKLSEVYQKLTS